MSMDEVLYIVNPAGHGGAGLQAWAAFQEVWGVPIPADHVHVTERPGRARELAARSTGYEVVAAVGGDGTVGEAISGVMDRDDMRPRLAIVPGAATVVGGARRRSVRQDARQLRSHTSRCRDPVARSGSLMATPAPRRKRM